MDEPPGPFDFTVVSAMGADASVGLSSVTEILNKPPKSVMLLRSAV